MTYYFSCGHYNNIATLSCVPGSLTETGWESMLLLYVNSYWHVKNFQSNKRKKVTIDFDGPHMRRYKTDSRFVRLAVKKSKDKREGQRLIGLCEYVSIKNGTIFTFISQ